MCSLHRFICGHRGPPLVDRQIDTTENMRLCAVYTGSHVVTGDLPLWTDRQTRLKTCASHTPLRAVIIRCATIFSNRKIDVTAEMSDRKR